MERFEAAFFSLERQATLISAIGATPDPGFRIPNKGPVSGIAPALPGCTLKTGSVPSRANVNEEKNAHSCFERSSFARCESQSGMLEYCRGPLRGSLIDRPEF
jgi:hypothetical protein